MNKKNKLPANKAKALILQLMNEGYAVHYASSKAGYSHLALKRLGDEDHEFDLLICQINEMNGKNSRRAEKILAERDLLSESEGDSLFYGSLTKSLSAYFKGGTK